MCVLCRYNIKQTTLILIKSDIPAVCVLVVAVATDATYIHIHIHIHIAASYRQRYFYLPTYLPTYLPIYLSIYIYPSIRLPTQIHVKTHLSSRWWEYKTCMLNQIEVILANFGTKEPVAAREVQYPETRKKLTKMYHIEPPPQWRAVNFYIR